MNLAEVFKDIEKISGKHSIMEGVELKDVERIQFPAIGLTHMLYGGLPKGRIIEFAGPEASGKTSTALLFAGEYQRHDSRPVFFVDAEGTYDPRWAEKLGVDNSKGKFIKWAPENATAEEVFQVLLDTVSTGEVGLVILDSIPTLVTQQEDAKSMSEYTMGGIAAALTKFVRKLQKLLLKHDDIIFIGLNQLRDNMTGYGEATKTVGGRAWKHICSIRLTFKSELIDDGGKKLSESAENPSGVKIGVALRKNKTAPRDRKLSFYFIDFTSGFNRKFDIVQMAIDEEVIKRSGSSYMYLDKETEEVIYKAQGRAKFIEGLPDEILKLIEEDILK